MSVFSRLLSRFRGQVGPATPASASDSPAAGCNPPEAQREVRFMSEEIEVPAAEWEQLVADNFSYLDVLAPDVAPWIADLPTATVPKLVIEIPFEGVPRSHFVDANGRRVAVPDRMRDWLTGARCMGTLYVQACTIAEAFEAYDEERREGRPPGRLYQGDGE